MPVAAERSRGFDVAVIGAGPAGLAAVEVFREFSIDVVVIDEQPRSGGQILRQPPASFEVGNWLASPLYDRIKTTLRNVDRCPEVHWKPGSTVLGLQPVAAAPTGTGMPGFDICLQSEAGCEIVTAATVVLAPGCYERPLPLPGWTLPGVLGAGGIQAFIKSQQFVPGKRFVLAGSHPLQLIVADQLRAADATVAAVVFSQPLSRALRLLNFPLAMLQGIPQLSETAGTLRRLRRHGTRVLFGRSPSGIEGESAVERVRIAPVGSDGRLNRERSEIIECDRVGLCHGFSVSSELARQAGAEVEYAPDRGGWLVRRDRWFQSSIGGLFVAGEITGLAGADASLAKGRIAAFGVLRALGLATDSDAERDAQPTRRRLARIERFAAMLNELSRPLHRLAESALTAETVICRCERLTQGELLAKLEEHPHIRSADAVKLCTRAGMGMCQGRFCAEQVARTVARVRGLTADAVGTFRTQFPVKPLNLGLTATPGKRR